MIEVYYYLPAEELDVSVECGLKLSKWFEKEVIIEGDLKKCMTAWLNPKDNIGKYKSDEFICVKLEISPKYCFVADKNLYRTALKNPELMNLYLKSIIPVEKYIFGSYRLPECLITSTVIGEYVSVLNKRIDTPILFERSETLYINNLIETSREKNNNFYDVLLYYYYSKLANSGKFDKIEDNDTGICLFINKRNGEWFVFKIPDIDYC